MTSAAFDKYITTLGDYDHRYEIRKFLLYIARNANEKRFFPFPQFYRKINQADESARQDEIKNKNENENESVPRALSEYSSEEFALVRAALARITDDFIKNLPDVYTMKERLDDTHELRFARYLFDGKINIAFHGENDLFIKYQFNYATSKERIFNFQHKQRWLLFHGSPLGNYHSILRNGLRSMSGTKFMTSGQAYGPGIYATDDIKVARGYGDCVMIIELIVDPICYRKSHSIYVIAHDNIVTPRYLLQFKTGKKQPALSDLTGLNGLLTEHKNDIERAIAFKASAAKYNARIHADLTNMVDKIPDIYCLDEIKDVKANSVCGVLYKNILFEVLFEDYPFKSPIIKLGQNDDEVPARVAARVNSYGVITYEAFEKWLPTCNMTQIFLEIISE